MSKRQSITHRFELDAHPGTVGALQRALNQAIKAGVPLTAKIWEAGWELDHLTAEWSEEVRL